MKILIALASTLIVALVLAIFIYSTGGDSDSYQTAILVGILFHVTLLNVKN